MLLLLCMQLLVSGGRHKSQGFWSSKSSEKFPGTRTRPRWDTPSSHSPTTLGFCGDVGYPFDIPDPRGGILSYAALVYHLPLLIAFSVRQSTSFVWGGCMLFPLKSMAHDSYGIMQAWREGGYSDDLIVAAKCAEHELKILCPSSAVFPQRCLGPLCISSKVPSPPPLLPAPGRKDRARKLTDSKADPETLSSCRLEADYSWQQYRNYLRRQLYVLDTYASSSNRRTNHSLMLIHSYLSWAVILPATTGQPPPSPRPAPPPLPPPFLFSDISA